MKFEKLKQIIGLMGNENDPKLRPNCSEILNQLNDWTLNECEIISLKIFDEMPLIFLCPENEFFMKFFYDKKRLHYEKRSFSTIYSIYELLIVLNWIK